MADNGNDGSNAEWGNPRFPRRVCQVCGKLCLVDQAHEYLITRKDKTRGPVTACEVGLGTRVIETLGGAVKFEEVPGGCARVLLSDPRFEAQRLDV